jgi:hypothetical protein
LLLNFLDWWTFDDTLTSSGPGNNTFVHAYSGNVSYEPSPHGKQLHGEQELFAYSDLYDNADWSLSFWWDTSDNSGTRTASVGVGAVGSVGTNYHAGVFLASNGATLGTYIRTNGTGGTEQGSYIPFPYSGRVFVCLLWDESAKTFSSYINGNLFADETIASSPPSLSNSRVFIRNTNGSAFEAIRREVDELASFNNYLLTAEDIQYLYNGGAGKSYADVVSDAS